MKSNIGYQVVGCDGALSSSALAVALSEQGQLLAPMLELITAGKAAVDESIDVMGRATIAAVLRISTSPVSGEPHQGK